jgi:hypothetical protein
VFRQTDMLRHEHNSYTKNKTPPQPMRKWGNEDSAISSNPQILKSSNAKQNF